MDLQGAPGSFQHGIVTRVKSILLQPAAEWDVIDKEPAEVSGLYKNYVMILAAIGPVAALIHSLAFGNSFLGITYRPSIMSAFGTAIFTYLITLVGVFVLAMVIDALAPNFGATKNRIQAFKIAAYSGTASWVAGIFGLIPGLGWLSILGLYSLYLLYLGLPKLMKAPADKAMSYTVVTIIAAFVLSLLATAIVAPVVALFAGSSALSSDSGTVSGTLSVPGVGSVDMGKLDQLGKQAEAASKQIESGQSTAIPSSALEALLPATIGGLPRTKLSSASAGAGGLGGSNAEARYEAGESNITLSVTDLSAAGAIASLGSVLNVQTNETTPDGYKKAGTVDGRMTTEEWDNGDKSGSIGVLVSNRFMVEAKGRGTDMDTLKAAVAGINAGQLEALAK